MKAEAAPQNGDWMAINRPNDRFSIRSFRLKASTPPAIEHLPFASPDSCAESVAEPSIPEPAMITQQAMMKDTLSPHTPSPSPADGDETVTGTDIVYPAGLQPQPVESFWQHRLAAGTLAMLSGEPAAGKHWVALAISAALPCGRDPLTGEKLKPATVLYASAARTLPRKSFNLASPVSRGSANQARCSNKSLEHLEHLRETNDLFGNVAK